MIFSCFHYQKMQIFLSSDGSLNSFDSSRLAANKLESDQIIAKEVKILTLKQYKYLPSSLYQEIFKVD